MPRLCPLLPLLLALLGLSLPGHAAEPPRIGLVLSGGGARGSAHIGVLKVLEEMRIPVHVVAATSMGSIVGGAWASGRDAAELETIVTRIDWRDLFQDDPPRQEKPVRRKLDDRRSVVNATLGYGEGTLRLPKGAVNGQKLGIFLRDLTRNAEGIHNFDEMNIPFRAIGTDLESGGMKVFDSGDLALAMRASMSVPTAFAPVEIDGRLYVDGGLTRNLPVDVVRAMGVDVVIAVNLGTPLLKRDELGSVIGVTAQMINILTEQNVQAQLQALRPGRDVLILPQLSDISAADFERAPEAIASGERAARAVAAELARYSVDPVTYAAWQARHNAQRPAIEHLDEVRISGLKRVNPTVAERVLIPPKSGDGLPRADLEKRVGELYGYGDFERIDYRVLRENGRDLAIVDTVEKTWGPTYIRFGLGMSTDFRGDSNFALRSSINSTWMNALGAEWKTDLQLGNTAGFVSEFYQPLQAGPGLFVAPYVEGQRETISLFDGERRVARYDVKTYDLGVDVGSAIGNDAELRLGLLYGGSSSDVDTGVDAFPDQRLDEGGLRLRFVYDTLDSLDFPHAGTRFAVSAYRALEAFGADSEYGRVRTDWLSAFTVGQGTLLASAYAGSNFGGELPFYNQFTLGGFMRLSGYDTDRFRGDKAALGRLTYYYRLDARPANMDLYLGGSLEYGRVWASHSPLDAEGEHGAASVFFGVDSFLGPAYFGVGVNDEGDTGFYMLIGRPW